MVSKFSQLISVQCPADDLSICTANLLKCYYCTLVCRQYAYSFLSLLFGLSRNYCDCTINFKDSVYQPPCGKCRIYDVPRPPASPHGAKRHDSEHHAIERSATTTHQFLLACAPQSITHRSIVQIIHYCTVHLGAIQLAKTTQTIVHSNMQQLILFQKIICNNCLANAI